MRRDQGLTLIEVAIILTSTFAILGALAPTLSSVIRHAETTAATTAMGKIQLQVLQMLTDLNFSNFTIDGTKNGTQVNLLVTDGDTPRQVSATGSALWQPVVDNTGGLTDFLERHLVMNQPRGSALNAYSTTANAYWKGAYLTAPLDPDPWGNRFGVNAQYLGNDNNDVVVYSAGPDEEIDTQFTANPLAAGDDDLIVLVEA
jgi:hypothetical protein